ncbi:MAG: hypothetical protein ABW321_03750 [Polyangiales bacterium]
MALLSILLSVVAVVCTLAGFLTTPIPVLGLVFSFGAAAIALGGIMLGGKAVSAAKRRGEPNDAARIAVVLNVLALVPALLVAFTCGVCNAVFSTGNVQLHKDLRFDIDPRLLPHAGAGAPLEQPTPDAPDQPGQPTPPENPGKLPPPPLPAGPGR